MSQQVNRNVAADRIYMVMAYSLPTFYNVAAMEQKLLEVVTATKYPIEAFAFIQRGLDYTVRHIHGDLPQPDADTSVSEQDFFPEDDEQMATRHIAGKQLCWGLRDYAVCEYGLMARVVLRHWRINDCQDFGHIVFAMVDAGLMFKTEGDSIADFTGVYDFNEAFQSHLQLGD